jgi:hypothetical protein
MSQQRKKAQNAALISFLINSAYYFIDCVYILRGKGLFRLIVLHKGKVLKDSYYRTARGARTAFSRVFKKRSWKESVKAEWTDFYSPEREWLNDKAA